MGLFNKIIEKLHLKKKEEPAAAPAKIVAAERPEAAFAAGQAAKAAKDAEATMEKVKATVAAQAAKEAPDAAAAPAAPVAISVVDVVKHLEELSAGKDLNWKVSIVDLLKLLDIDSSGEARKELAEELGCPADQMSDSARMNVWLHKEVLKKIAENGGNIPANLLD